MAEPNETSSSRRLYIQPGDERAVRPGPRWADLCYKGLYLIREGAENRQKLCSTDLFESVIFPEEFQRFHRLLSVMQPLWVTGRVLEEFRVVSLQVMGVPPAERPQRRTPTIPQLPPAAGRGMICADVGH